jgi:hypothetical protein
MRHIVLLLAAIVTIAASAAPADQYFGKLKMSTLRIRYEIAQVKNKYEFHKLLPEEAAHLAQLDQDAFEDWARKYPHDDWLASTAYNLAKLYEELPGDDARDRATHLLTFINAHFPKTRYATEARTDLHRGVPSRPDPAWAVSMRQQRASASPSPAASASAASAAPAPAGSMAPSPSPSPAASGSPAPLGSKPPA